VVRRHSHQTELLLLTKDYPDHHDADLVLRLYDMRRENIMRESRAAINSKYWPKTVDEALSVMKSDHPLNAPFRQVVTYWEMAYGMCKWGIVHADFMVESASEGLLVYAKAEPYMEQIRQANPAYFVNAEWVAKNSPAAQKQLERYRARIKRTLDSK
jgi:hypothetical protein